MNDHQTTTSNGRSLAGLVVLFLVVVPAQVASAESRELPSTTKTEAKTTDDDRERKRSAARAAMYVVWGIAGVGVVLIAGVLLWGARIRRRARNDRLEPQPHDPLWYLKTNKQNRPTSENPAPPDNSD